jgi:hypothetical protein
MNNPCEFKSMLYKSKQIIASLHFRIVSAIFQVLTGRILTWNVDERFLEYVLDPPRSLC